MTDAIDATAPTPEAAPAAGTEPAAAAAPSADELASLRSRNSGLNAKVTELQKLLADRESELGNARKGLTDKEAGDADLRKQLADLQARLEAQTKAAEVASLQARFPEASKELGENIYGMKPETLASLEARLTARADAGTPETPRPVGNNPQREPVGQKRPEDMSAEELRAAIKGFTRSDFGLS